VIRRGALLTYGRFVELKRSRLDLITYTKGIKIVMYKGVSRNKILWQILNFEEKSVFWLEEYF
jgi:hypothetical protein